MRGRQGNRNEVEGGSQRGRVQEPWCTCVVPHIEVLLGWFAGRGCGGFGRVADALAGSVVLNGVQGPGDGFRRSGGVPAGIVSFPGPVVAGRVLH
jgi:hypothetical protein